MTLRIVLAMAGLALAAAAPRGQQHDPTPKPAPREPARAQDPPPAPAAPIGDPAGKPAVARSVERHGITWTFASEHVVGTFANGDPWVLGPVRIVGITPASVEEGGRVKNGSMVDPDPTILLQGYDSAMFGDANRENYRDALNVGAGIGAERPLELAADSSLISVVSRADPKACPTLQAAAVLTCVRVVPAPDAFRPPYVRGPKTSQHRAADLDFTSLQRVAPVGDPPAIEVIAKSFERVWLDHFPEWTARYLHPLDNMPDYGRDIASLVGSGALALQLDVPNEQKRTLLIRMVQLGIDLHGSLRGGCRWRGLGGHGSGRKLPILLAGQVLGDERMLAIGRDYRSVPKLEGGTGGFFAEDSQTFVVRETSPGVWNHGHGGYGKQHDGLPEWGHAHCEHMESDNVSWDANPYRRCCSANGWLGATLAARMLGLREAWNHDVHFDYVDRYVQAQHTEGWHRAWAPWHVAMWDRYRKDF